MIMVAGKEILDIHYGSPFIKSIAFSLYSLLFAMISFKIFIVCTNSQKLGIYESILRSKKTLILPPDYLFSLNS